jgi:hypothetical protein
VPQRQELAKKLKTQYGDKSLGEIKVDNVFGGMRGLKVMLWDPSVFMFGLCAFKLTDLNCSGRQRGHPIVSFCYDHA